MPNSSQPCALSIILYMVGNVKMRNIIGPDLLCYFCSLLFGVFQLLHVATVLLVIGWVGRVRLIFVDLSINWWLKLVSLLWFLTLFYSLWDCP